MSEHCYSVGGFVLSVSLPSAVSPDILLPSFRPFKAGGSHDGVELLRFAARPLSSMPEVDVVRLLDDSDNDMGHIRLYSVGGGYLVELCSAFGGAATACWPRLISAACVPMSVGRMQVWALSCHRLSA